MCLFRIFFRFYNILIKKNKFSTFVIYKIQLTKSFLKININVSCGNSKNITREKIINNCNHFIISVLHIVRVSSFSSILFMCLFASIWVGPVLGETNVDTQDPKKIESWMRRECEKRFDSRIFHSWLANKKNRALRALWLADSSRSMVQN